MLLYDNQVSGNCYKVRLLFAQLGIEYERREVDVFDRSARLELLGDLNPALRVPTLVLDDGRPLAAPRLSSLRRSPEPYVVNLHGTSRTSHRRSLPGANVEHDVLRSAIVIRRVGLD